MLGWVPLPTVPQRLRSYSTLRLPAVFGTSSGVPLPTPTLAATASFLPERPVPSRYVTGHSQEIAVRLPLGRSIPGNNRVSQVTGPSSYRAPNAKHPDDCNCPSPSRAQPLLPSRDRNPWAVVTLNIFGAGTPGSRSRPTYASTAPLLGQQQGCLPTCPARL